MSSECQYDVQGMHCAGCASRVQKKVLAVPGVATANVNLVGHCMTVSGDFVSQNIVDAVVSAGFKCTPVTQEKPAQAAGSRVLLYSVLLWLAVFILMLVRMLFMNEFTMIPVAQLLLTVAVFIVNRQLFANGFRHLFSSPDMDSLVTLGCIASFVLSCYALFCGEGHFYFESAAMILAIVTFGKYLEGKAKKKAGEAIDKLRELAPKDVVVVRGDKETTITASDVKVGDVILVKPGNAVPMDGAIIDGISDVNESTLTGESLPRSVGIGDPVYAGTMNLTGAFKFKVEHTSQDTLLAGIIKIVSSTAVSRNKAVRLADRLAAVFVPVVASLAILTFIVHCLMGQSAIAAMSNAISVLVVSCPCALGLATPVAVTIATARAARAGILFKSGNALELLHKAKNVFFDKTGTLTTGRLVVSDVLANGIDECSLLEIASAMESLSEHPIAKAVVAELKKRDMVSSITAREFQNVAGRGVKARIEGEECLAGNMAFMEEHSVAMPETLKESAKVLQADGKSILYVARGNDCIGMIAVQDSVDENTVKAMKCIRDGGMTPIMLTGDNANTAKSMARRLGIDEIHAGLLPAAKAQIIAESKSGGQVAVMVGDGINDAPALNSADVGIAIGTGADIALDCADIVIMQNDMARLVEAIGISRRTTLNIKENLCWAFAYNLLMIPVAAGILMPFGIQFNPMLSAVAMSLSSLCVVGNALRLMKN